MINHYIAIVSRFPKNKFGLKVKETKKEVCKAEKRYVGISSADIKTSLILSLYFDSYSGKSLLFLTDRHINMKPTRESGICLQTFVYNVQWNMLNTCGSDIYSVQKHYKFKMKMIILLFPF